MNIWKNNSKIIKSILGTGQWWIRTVFPATQERDKRIVSEAESGRPYLKNEAKRAGYVAQVVGHQPRKLRVLNSNPNTTKK
jgi:hypothetical protein